MGAFVGDKNLSVIKMHGTTIKKKKEYRLVKMTGDLN